MNIRRTWCSEDGSTPALVTAMTGEVAWSIGTPDII
jgi:hypothetical protein